ncbi:hypothetical protein [Flavobacterium piscisymbiosum]|uniref:Uncharacterized protein n=1 Tax=Flavobacterium piscisymbiosum TaxID=2893753 RepID=A0ABS8MDM6_9FLAO|nr:hypothetical protein [Flavobacterium sp. F-30]MCC9063621.1 hypothetical protein [Flavobacterium sp. F-30]
MAKFEGTLPEFIDFIGPMTRNIVCDLSRSFKKNTTCRHDGCNKRKPLEAAHLKGKERPKIIGDILSLYEVDSNIFEVDLIEFKKLFIEAHTPIENIILPMCKQHHLEYDRKENIATEYPILLDEFDNEDGQDTYTQQELDNLKNSEVINIEKAIKESSINKIKEVVINKYKVEKKQITFSKISDSNGLWNFDVNKNKFNNIFCFIFFTQSNKTYKVAVINANTLPIEQFPEKNKNTIRFFVDKQYKDRTGFQFELNNIEYCV